VPTIVDSHPTMTVQTLFFAAYRDLLGASTLDVQLAEGATVADLVRELRGRGAPFDSLPAEPAVAVNRAYARLDVRLGAGDEVAFIPPVAGG
jgi:molybdopterin converting factor subunit 1